MAESVSTRTEYTIVSVFTILFKEKRCRFGLDLVRGNYREETRGLVGSGRDCRLLLSTVNFIVVVLLTYFSKKLVL